MGNMPVLPSKLISGFFDLILFKIYPVLINWKVSFENVKNCALFYTMSVPSAKSALSSG
jgi:hypothetical protein